MNLHEQPEYMRANAYHPPLYILGEKDEFDLDQGVISRDRPY
jgi:hypothetical protein